MNNPPDPQAAPKALVVAGNKRARDGPGDAERSSKKSRTSATGTAASNKAKKRPPSEMYRLMKKELPVGGKSVLDAFNLHLRILMNHFEPNTAPPLPSEQAVSQFNLRYSSVPDVFRERFLKPAPGQLQLLSTIANLRTNPGGSKIAINASRVEENMLRTVIASQCHFGLAAFRPNFFDTPYSPYNAAHRIFAIDTFRQLAVAGAYFFLRPKLSLIDEVTFMTEAYNHIVHYEFQDQAKLEKRKGEGAVAAQHMKDNIYQRRLRTSKSRAEYMFKEERAAPRYVDLVLDPAATSDDEAIPGRVNEFEVLEKKRRNPRYAQFVQNLDTRRREVAESKSRYTLRERIRHRPADPKPSPLLALPAPGIPLDFFGPVIFNSLPYPIRCKYSRNPRIALPRDDNNIWKRKYMEMRDEDFMRLEGNDILKEYDIVRSFSDDDDAEDDGMDLDLEPQGSASQDAQQQQQFVDLMRDTGAAGPSAA